MDDVARFFTVRPVEVVRNEPRFKDDDEKVSDELCDEKVTVMNGLVEVTV